MEQVFLMDNFQNCYLKFEGVDFVRLFMVVTGNILQNFLLCCVSSSTISIITAFAKTKMESCCNNNIHCYQHERQETFGLDF